MTITLRVFAFILMVIYFVAIFRLLKKKKFALKYSLLWLFGGIVMLALVIWPGILEWVAKLLGIKVASNGLFAMLNLLEIMIMISFTIVISDFSVKIKRLIQYIALLEKRIRVLETQFDGESDDND